VELCKSRINILSLDEETLLHEAKNINLEKIRTAIRQVSIPSSELLPSVHLRAFESINFYRAMLCISAVHAVIRCPSVCLSIRLSRS